MKKTKLASKKVAKSKFKFKLKFKLFHKIKDRIRAFLNRRPHRSFRRTKRRDYVKKFELPGYISFTKSVLKLIWSNRKKFIIVILLYAILTIVMVGIASEDTYSTLKETISASSGNFFSGTLGDIEKSGLLFLTAFTGGISNELSEAQQIYAGILIIMAWLTNVWLLRNILAGHKVKVRDALYSAGAPILPTFMVAMLFIIQLIPIALAMVGYGAASTTGLLSGGVEAMMFWIAAGFLAVLSIYWITSTIISLVVVTLPGMYPYQAIKIGGDLVVGRRLKIVLRFIWMIVLLIIFWAIILIPIIMLDSWLKDVWSAISWLPTVPVMILLLSSFSIVWISSYVYLLYRKVVADDAASA